MSRKDREIDFEGKLEEIGGYIRKINNDDSRLMYNVEQRINNNCDNEEEQSRFSCLLLDCVRNNICIGATGEAIEWKHLLSFQ